MTTLQYTVAIAVFAFTACSGNRTQEAPKQEVPKALEDKSSSYEIVSKRGYDNLVEELYQELVRKDVDLKNLEDKIEGLQEGKNDSTALFAKYNAKNLSYFTSATGLAGEINDSVTRDRMTALVARQLKQYNASIARHNDLLKIIEDRQLTIADLHKVLKIVRTLPVIDKFQRENLPATKPFENFIKQQEQVIKLADTLARK